MSKKKKKHKKKKKINKKIEEPTKEKNISDNNKVTPISENLPNNDYTSDKGTENTTEKLNYTKVEKLVLIFSLIFLIFLLFTPGDIINKISIWLNNILH